MPKWFDNFADKTIGRLGYVKASDISPSVVFAGESSIAPNIDFSGYTDDQNERLALTTSWVYSNIRVIANEASKSDFYVVECKGEDEVEVQNHDFEIRMVKPNEKMGGAFLRQYTLWWWLLRGEAYWMWQLTNAGGIAGIWPIPATRMTPIQHPTEYISGYKYTPRHGRKPVTLLPQQICYFRFPNPFDYHRGLSPISAYKTAMQTDFAAAKWNLDTFANSVTLQTLISLSEKLSGPNFQIQKAEILEELVERQRRFMIARAGDIDVETLSMSPKDVEYLKGREFTREEIDRVYGVPAGYWAKEATRANSLAAKQALIDQAVAPLLKLMEEEITAQGLAMHYDDDLRGHFSNIRPEDRALVVRERNQYWQARSFNEARADLGAQEYDGPLAETIGDLPFPLATNPQFVAALAGIAPTMGGPGGAMMSVTGDGNGKELREDLRRWKSIAVRRLRNGESLDYNFESKHISTEAKASIAAALAEAETEEEVKAAFAAPFLGLGAEGATAGHPDWSRYP